jgi:peptidoglycan/LPS O-acetylase OafA/YrhL
VTHPNSRSFAAHALAVDVRPIVSSGPRGAPANVPYCLPVRRLNALTSLRFFAAAIVLLYHCGRHALWFMPLEIRGLMESGYDAVSFFFVLSGFVLAYSYYIPGSLGVRGGVRAFWKSRFARIYPIYVVASLIALPMYLWGLKTGTVQIRDARIALMAVPLLMQSWFLSKTISGAINLPAWSLSVEAFFYCAFPLLLRMTIRVGPIVTTALAYVGLFCSESLLRHAPYFPLYHLFTFIIGIGCGVWFRRVSLRNMQFSFYCAALSLLGFLGFRDVIPGAFVGRPVIVPIFGILMITAASCAGTLKFLEHRFLVLLGDASYSLYILHLPLYLLFQAALRRAHVSLSESLFWTLFYLISIVPISVLSHEWIEVRARSRLQKRLMFSSNLPLR